MLLYNKEYIVFQCCDLLQGLIPTKEEKGEAMTPRHYEHLYIFTLMWSIGAFLELDDRAKLEEFIRGCEDISLDLPNTSVVPDSTMFDYYVDEKGNDNGMVINSKVLRVDEHGYRISALFGTCTYK